jgi:uncharacterized membrane protein
VKDAARGTPEAKYFLLFNALIAFSALVFVVGYPLVITLALIGTGLGLSWVILLSMGDVIEKHMSRHAAKARRKQEEQSLPLRKAA